MTVYVTHSATFSAPVKVLSRQATAALLSARVVQSARLAGELSALVVAPVRAAAAAVSVLVAQALVLVASLMRAAATASHAVLQHSNTQRSS